ncbi:MAG TPA: response regulator [Pyrinomonadaceae bacterium]|nr:response regulator [Pyrinomonadaceae bacterium]
MRDARRRGFEASILYAEEAAAVADAVRETLEAEGWRVEVFARGDEALRRLGEGARFDLLILSFTLPGVDGLELARRVCAAPGSARSCGSRAASSALPRRPRACSKARACGTEGRI